MSEPIETPYLRAAFLAGPLAAVASIAAAWIAVFVAGGVSSLGGAVRGATRTWLVAIGSGISVDDVAITVVPVGAWMVAVGLIALVTRWVLNEPVDGLPAFVASTGGVVGLIAAVAAAVSSSGGGEVGFVRAAIAGFVAGAVGSAWGAVARHGGGDTLWFTISEDLRRAVRSALPGVATLLIASSLIVIALLFAHRQRAGDLWALLDPGFGGGIALAIACLLALPTAVLWTASALLGPGFSVGTDTSVDLTGSHLGAVPGFPVLAALPSPGQFPDWVFVLGLIPLFAGGVAGWRADTGGRHGLTARVVAGAAAGAVAGFIVGVMVGVSGGAIGPGRMAEAGPPSLTPLLVGVLVLGLGGALGAALAHYRDGRVTE